MEIPQTTPYYYGGNNTDIFALFPGPTGVRVYLYRSAELSPQEMELHMSWSQFAQMARDVGSIVPAEVTS